MKAQTETLTIDAETFAWAESQLRSLQLAAERAREAGGSEAEELHGECVRLCEEILSWREKVAQKGKELRVSEAAAIDEAGLGPAQRRLAALRRDLSNRYEKEVPPELRRWLATWTLRVEGAVLEKSLQWIRQASIEVEAWERLWQGAKCRYRGLTLLGRFRAFRLAKRARESEARLQDLSRETQRARARVGQLTSETKVLAGMLSVFLKLHAGDDLVENRIVNRVLELDREREVERLLQSSIDEARASLKQVAEHGRGIEEATRTRRSEHGKLEHRKNVQMLEAWTEGARDPCRLIAEATERQIVAAWGEVERNIERELLSAREVQRQEKRLEDEFERLMGVVREYEEAKQAEKGRGDAADGVQTGTSREARRDPEGLRH